APPRRADIHTAPVARPRSRNGNHELTTRVMFGYAPASPQPNRKRTANRATKLLSTSGPHSRENGQTQPVSAVKMLHQMTMRVSTRRGPHAAPNQPPGTSNSV